jgi:alkyldihydroxyacetonephosphate synthase
LDDLYRAVGSALDGALRAQGTPPIVMCHLSHAYRDGASLYYTFIAPSKPGAELEHWRALKGAACDAIVATGGTITHHHAVGRDHAPYMKVEVGEVGLEALRALKERLDPAGIMNPGKLGV